MPKKRQRSFREYKFKIDAYTPDSIPMWRLAEYLSDLAIILGNRERVHFNRLEPGSTMPVIRVEWEAEPKVRDRIHLVKWAGVEPTHGRHRADYKSAALATRASHHRKAHVNNDMGNFYVDRKVEAW